MPARSMSLFPLLLFPVLLAPAAVGQCVSDWQPVSGYQGIDGAVYASTMWDQDGPGPLPPLYVIGGSFTAAGSELVSNIAAYDPATGQWSALGRGTNQSVHTVLAMPNGELVVGGNFTQAGGSPAACIARWNGSTWSPLGAGMDSTVDALALDANGDLLAGGGFASAGGTAAVAIARWDGTGWSAVGSYFPTGPISIASLAVLPNGNIVAGGFFGAIGGTYTGHVAMWNGSAWLPLGAGVLQGSGYPMVRSLRVMPNGDLLAYGPFTQIGNVLGSAARWNGVDWFPVTGPLASGVPTFLPNGDILVADTVTVGASTVQRWDGVSWSQLGGAFDGSTRVTVLPNGDIAAAGLFTRVGNTHARSVARWNGLGWEPLSIGGFNAPVRSLLALPDGGVVVGGDFTFVGNVAASRVARFDGSAWSSLGSGTNSSVRAIGSLPNGDLVIGGEFTTAGGVPVTGLARWNGTAWSAIPGGPLTVDALAIAPNGDLVVSGIDSFAPWTPRRVARWDGSTWTTLGVPTIQSAVSALAFASNGDLYAGGDFLNLGGSGVRYVARWTGSTWAALGTGLDYVVRALLPTENGDLLVAGQFSTAGGTAAAGIARWNGTAWSAFGAPGAAGTIQGLGELPNGNVLAYGYFSNHTVARWDGSTWAPFGAFGNALPYCLAPLPNGEVLLGGQITRVEGQVANHLARLVPTCPATATAFGAGCNSLVGPMELTAASLPWTNGRYRATCSGMSAAGIGIGVFGFTQPGIALSLLHPAGGAGCTLWVSQDLLTLLLPQGGTVTDELVIPANPALVGMAVLHQVLQLEFSGANLARISGSNGRSLTIGTY